MPLNRSWGKGLAAVCAAALVAYVSYGTGFVSLDPMFSLVWGRDLASGRLPDFRAGGPTPHPLSNLVAAALSIVGDRVEGALVAISYLSLGAMAYATWLVASRLAGSLAAAVAVALLLSRAIVANSTALAYLDVPYAALVMIAVALETGSPRRGTPVLVVLVFAGLLRPEGWILSGLYWLWLSPAWERRSLLRASGFVLIAPATWLLMDLVITGNALFSFSSTTAAAQVISVYGSGPTAIFTDGPGVMSQAVAPAVALASVFGLAVLLRFRRTQGIFFVGTLVSIATATFIPVAAGTLLSPRYTLTLVALLCVLAGVAAAGCTAKLADRAAWQLGSAVAVLMIVATSVGQFERLLDVRRNVERGVERRNAARAIVSGQLPCLPLVTPNGRLVPFAVIWRDAPQSSIVSSPAKPGSFGTYVSGTPEALEGLVISRRRDADTSVPPVPLGATRVRERDGWLLYDYCAAGRPPRK